MTLSRPVAIGILALLAALVLWLMLGQRAMDGEPDADAGAAPSSTGTFATMDDEPESTPAEESESAEESAEESASEPAAEEEPTDGTESEWSVGVDTRDWDDIDACADGILPQELEPVVDDIEAGGPYDYPGKDGSTFGNFEGYLPDESRGYYQEFTVETPGLNHRGAKRVVTGGGEVEPEVWYYTDDHYESFCEFAPGA